MGSIAFRTEHRQQQTLSPKLQHAVRLLQLSSLDFAQAVHQALGRNPFLEMAENEDDSPALEVKANVASAADAANDSDAGPSGESDREVWQTDGFPSGQRIGT